MKKVAKNIVSLVCFIGLMACESGKDVCSDSSGGLVMEEDATLRGAAASFIAKAGDRVFFAYDSVILTQENKAVLARQVAWLEENPSKKVLIEGHCDERGTREYNLGLGERRANAVAQFLIQNNIASNRVRTISYGKDRPITAQGPREEIYRVNRVAISVVE